MSENSTPEERTEDPTEKRMGQLRKQGAIHFSSEIVQVTSLISGFLVLQYMSGKIFSDMKLILVKTLAQIGNSEPINAKVLHQGLIGVIGIVGPDILIVAAVVAAISASAVLLQTKFNIKEKKFDLRISNINPIQGLKRIFSIQGVMNTLKAIAKLSVILPIGYFALKHFAPRMIELVHYSIPSILTFTANAMSNVFWKIAYILCGIAIFDFVWGKRQWLRQNRMTKEEIKDERKSIEGDEATKRKIQAKGLQRIMQRIRNTVPKADVIVTNPTHYAVALKYDRNTMTAPTVVAKGKGFLALQIRKLAAQSGVPVLERKALARALYASSEVGSQIPRDLFRAVAEVLAYVYKQKNKFKPQSQVNK